MKKIIKYLLIIPLFFSLCGCEAFMEALELQEEGTSENPNSDNYRPRFVIGVFSIVQYPRASNLERQISTPDGNGVWINTNQNFSSKYLKDCRVIARPGDPDVCDLQFRLSRMGKIQWQMLYGAHRGEPVVLVVDSRYAGKFVPELPDEGNLEWITVRVGIDAYTAKGIAKFAKKNYTYYNPDTKSWFSI